MFLINHITTVLLIEAVTSVPVVNGSGATQVNTLSVCSVAVGFLSGCYWLQLGGHTHCVEICGFGWFLGAEPWISDHVHQVACLMILENLGRPEKRKPGGYVALD